MRNPNGYGAIIFLGKNRRKPWAIRVTVGFKNSKQVFKYLSYHEKRQDAIIALAEYNRNPYDLDASRITFKEIYDKWSIDALPKLEKTSQRAYTGGFNSCEVIHSKVFKDLKKAHLQNVIDGIDAPSSKRRFKLLINQLYKYAMENDIVSKNYAQFVKLEHIETQQKNPFSDKEIQILWGNLSEYENIDIILILIYTGLRVSELLDIPKNKINLNERYMIGGKKTTAGKNRTIPLCKKVLPLIKSRYNQGHKYLFVNKSGGRMLYDNFKVHSFRPIMKDLKMSHTIHETRHTFISMLDRLDINPVLLKRIVGHSNANVTERYTHKQLDEMLDAVDRL